MLNRIVLLIGGALLADLLFGKKVDEKEVKKEDKKEVPKNDQSEIDELREKMEKEKRVLSAKIREMRKEIKKQKKDDDIE